MVAQSAINDAQNGKLPFIDDYTLQFASGAFRTTVPMMFCDNMGFEKGDIAGVYADFDRGLLVYDFQEGSNYEEGRHVDE